MPVVSDFVEILGDSPETINNQGWQKEFNTSGRESGTSAARAAFLLFNVKGITSFIVPVRVNDVIVGQIFPYQSSNTSYWYTQMIALDGSQLRNGNNTVRINAQVNDTFEIKNMVCFFHQNA